MRQGFTWKRQNMRALKDSCKQLLRLFYIQLIFSRYGLDQKLFAFRHLSPFRFLLYLNPWRWFQKKSSLSIGVALRKTLEDLGPIFIKFGQALSTRPDVLPPEIAFELSKLQDNVPPFSSQEALNLIQSTYGTSAFELFASFDPIPLASASIAQVHPATLHSGEAVVVKILRPGIRKIINQDLALLRSLASVAERYWAESKRFKPLEIVAEFEFCLLNELDLRLEAANASQLKRNFSHSKLLYVPTIYWDYTHEQVLVMERIYGIPVSDLTQLKAAGINIKKLAERGVEIFFTQVFKDCFFHADMHPGNIFVSLQNPEDPQYLCVDFGIMGTLSQNDKRYLAENLYAFFSRDYRRVAELHIESGWIMPEAKVEAFESALRAVCEPIFQKPLKEISFAQAMGRLFEVAQRFQMQVQPQLILLQKTLLAIEGLGRQLYPELNLWDNAKPFLEKWLREELGLKGFIRRLKKNAPFLLEHLPEFPQLAYEVLLLCKTQKLHQAAEKEESIKEKAKGSRLVNKAWYKGIAAGIFASTALLFGTLNAEFAQITKLLLGGAMATSALIFLLIPPLSS